MMPGRQLPPSAGWGDRRWATRSSFRFDLAQHLVPGIQNVITGLVVPLPATIQHCLSILAASDIVHGTRKFLSDCLELWRWHILQQVFQRPFTCDRIMIRVNPLFDGFLEARIYVFLLDASLNILSPLHLHFILSPLPEVRGPALYCLPV